MALAGLPIPAERGSRIPVYATVAADIGDEQSIEQSLSTFSSHMRNIIHILASADVRALVLLDELGAGTDPTEGAALGRALLTHLLALGATFVATTHHGELKLFAHETAGVINASVEFDDETLSPTYRLSLGLRAAATRSPSLSASVCRRPCWTMPAPSMPQASKASSDSSPSCNASATPPPTPAAPRIHTPRGGGNPQTSPPSSRRSGQ